MDLTQFSTVVALANTSIISFSTLALWKLSNSVSEASFTLKKMSWRQQTAPPPSMRFSILGLVKLNALSTIHFINATTCILFCVSYCTVSCTVYFSMYCILYCTTYCENLLKDSPPTLKVTGHWCQIRYMRQKFTPKRRRFSTKLLKVEAESALNEPPLKRQRIFNIVNNSNVEQVRDSKRIPNRTLHPSKFCRFARQLQVFLKRVAPESLDNPLSRYWGFQFYAILRELEYYLQFCVFIRTSEWKRRRRIFTEPASIPNTPYLSIREHELFIVTLSLILALVNNRKKSRKEQLKEGISPKIRD